MLVVEVAGLDTDFDSDWLANRLERRRVLGADIVQEMSELREVYRKRAWYHQKLKKLFLKR